MSIPYPESARERDRWILGLRPPRAAADPRRPGAFLMEQERSASGEVVPVATLFLTNRECPWRCLVCDLWKHTVEETVPAGAIPGQIRHGLEALGIIGRVPPVVARQIKLYNSGSFFDPRAIPPGDLPGIASLVAGFERVIVECHPALVGEAAPEFQARLPGRLEVAMGLETAHPQVLERLNKRMTLAQFRRAACFLRERRIDLRVFILVKPPFLDEAEAVEWARRSIDFAFECGATVVSLIPTRGGNGALEALAARGQFSPPRLATLEAVADHGVRLGRGRVFVDLWDLEKFSDCPHCLAARRERLDRMNRTQQVEAGVACGCGKEGCHGA